MYEPHLLTLESYSDGARHILNDVPPDLHQLLLKLNSGEIDIGERSCVMCGSLFRPQDYVHMTPDGRFSGETYLGIRCIRCAMELKKESNETMEKW
jgi:hypothetical protein